LAIAGARRSLVSSFDTRSYALLMLFDQRNWRCRYSCHCVYHRMAATAEAVLCRIGGRRGEPDEQRYERRDYD
jgi:hypothetical protein